LKSEFTAKLRADDVAFVRAALDPEGFVGVVPVATQVVAPHATTVRGWGAYCAGTVGMGREEEPNTANAELFLMRGTTRWFDHDYTAIGSVVIGMDAVRSAAVGVPPKHPDAIRTVRVLADLPPMQQQHIDVLNVRSAAFRSLIDEARSKRGADFSVCDVILPVHVH
jgi:peptidylprolyl isomerase